MQRLITTALRGICLLTLSATTLATETLRDIAQSKTLTIAYRADTPPFSARADADAQPSGFSIDICNQIADRLKDTLRLETLQVRYVEVTASNRIEAITSGRAQMECGTTTVTLSRQEKVDFSNLIYATGATLLVPRNSPIKALRMINGESIAVVSDTTTEQLIRQQINNGSLNAELRMVKNHRESLELLEKGAVDAVAGDEATLMGIGHYRSDGGKYRLTADLLSFEPYGLMLPRGDADFRLAVNRALSDIYLSGLVGKMWSDWFSEYGVKPRRELLMLYRLNALAE